MLNLIIYDIESHVRDFTSSRVKYIASDVETHRHPTLLFLSIHHDKLGVMDKGSIQKALKEVLTDSGIHKRISPHSLRHCIATHLLQQNMENSLSTNTIRS